MKILQLSLSSQIYCKGYKLYKGNERRPMARIRNGMFSLLSFFSCTRRFFRAEITGLYTLENGWRLAIAKKGLYLCDKGCDIFELCFAIPRGSKPLNLCFAPSGNIYFGEYFQNMDKQAVNIYCSIYPRSPFLFFAL